MNGQDSLKRFDLKTVAAASFDWAGERYTVRSAPSPIFDTWVRQYVEEIQDVNTELWDIFDRWGIVKALLQGNFLTLSQEDGTSVLRGRAEEKSSVGLEELTRNFQQPVSVLELERQLRIINEHPPVAPSDGRDYPDLEGE